MQKPKLEKPVLRSKIIERPRLMRLLWENADKSVFVVCAPAGFGKSVAIRQWIKQQEYPTAWVSLGAPQNNFPSFLSQLDTAFRQFYPNSLEKMVHLSGSRNGREVSDIANEFSSAISEMNQPLGMVLDDYHSISDPEIHLFVRSLLQHPPKALKIVLITRCDPSIELSELRLYDRLFDLTMQDLFFTEEELYQFLRECNSEIPDKAFKNILEGSGGWILGVKLMLSSYFLNSNLVLKYRNQGDIEYLVNQLCGELSPEVFDALCLSTLLDRFTVDLLDSVFKVARSFEISGKEFIEEITRLNLFLTEDEDKKGWFRYQALFRKLIRSQCKHEESGRKQKVLSQASHWFAKNGYLDDAIEYAVTSENWELATAHITEYGRELLEIGDCWRVESWINKLPADIVLQKRSLLLFLMWINMYSWQLKNTQKLLLRFENLGPMKDLSPRSRAEFEVHVGHHYLFYHSDPLSALKYLNKSRNTFKHPGLMGGTRELCSALALQMTEGSEMALEGLDALEENYPFESPVYLRSLTTKVFVHLLSANFDKAEWESNKLNIDAGKSSYRYFLAWSHYLAGNIDFQYGRETVVTNLERAVYYEDAINKRILLDSLSGIALSYALDNDMANAWKAIENLRDKAARYKNSYFNLIVESTEKRIQLIGGKNRLSPVSPLPLGESRYMDFFWLMEVPRITQIKLRICTGGKMEIRQGLKEITALVHMLEGVQNVYHHLELYLLRALGYFQLGKHQKALKWLAQASLTYAHTKNIRPFAEIRMIKPEFYAWAPASHLPYEFNKKTEAPHAGQGQLISIQPEILSLLTNREIEIARLVALGLRNKEISEELNIREVTVKTHLTNIFRKLGIHNRTSLARVSDFL